MPIITPAKILREKLTDEGVDALVELINSANEKTKEDVIALSVEKYERRLAEVKSDLEAKIAQVEIKIAQTETRIIRWMFIFWVGQVGTITAILFAFFK